jgi:hypothetical protein
MDHIGPGLSRDSAAESRIRQKRLNGFNKRKKNVRGSAIERGQRPTLHYWSDSGFRALGMPDLKSDWYILETFQTSEYK